MSDMKLIDQVISAEEEARSIVRNAQKNSDEQIYNAYENRKKLIADAKQKARDIIKNASSNIMHNTDKNTYDNSKWSRDLDELVKKNFDKTVNELKNRSLDNVNS